MTNIGNYNILKVIKKVDFGMYLDGGDNEILLPKRFVPAGLKEGDEITVFLYYDSEDRIIATTQQPKGIVGDIVMLEAVNITNQGAFLDWELMKDLFVPLSQQQDRMIVGEHYIVKIYIDEQTGRVAATEKIARFLTNEGHSLHEKDEVDMIVWQKTDIGYKVIINNKHTGVLHYNEVFRDLDYGEKVKGFIKTIREEGKIDVSLGGIGYKKVAGEEEKIMKLLNENDGYLPYHDKSAPEDIYSFFGMSKKTFKMTLGALYKKQQIAFTKTGFKLNEEPGE